MRPFANCAVGLIAVHDPVEVADIPTVETWDRHDCKVTVTQPEGFLCKVQLRAKLDFPPDRVFDLLVDPDNSRYFSTVAALTYRKVLENNNKGRQRVEVEQAGQWRFLLWSGHFFTRLFVLEDKPEGVVEFKLAKEGFMKNFEGRWEIRPFDQHSLDEVSGRSTPWKNFGYQMRSFLSHSKPEATLITLEQSVLPKTAPPKWFEGYMTKVTASIIQTIIRDLRGEIDRVKSGRPIPKAQLKKLQRAKRITNIAEDRRKKENKSKVVPASLSLPQRRRRLHADILF